MAKSHRSKACVAALRLIGWGWVIIASLFLSAKARADVAADPTFSIGSGTDWFTEDVVPLANGKILVCGLFHTFNGQSAPFLVRLNEDGSLDGTFRTGLFNDWVRHLLVQGDGKIIAMGSFTNVAGKSRNLIARVNEDGSLDEAFNPGLGFEEKIVPPDPNPPLIFWGALQTDGKIVVVGSFAKLNGAPMSGIARLNADGTVDPSFHVGSGFNSWGRFVRVLPNGQILVSGWFTQYDNFVCNRMVRLNADGSADESFRPYFGDLTAIYSAAPLPDGKMIVSGHTKNENAFTRHIARLNPDGSEDPSFLGHSNNRTESILIQPDGKILITGFFTEVNGVARNHLARLNADGSLDESFKAELDEWSWTMAFDNQQRLLVTGMFHHLNGADAPTLARLLLNTSPVVLKADPKTMSVQAGSSVPVTLTASAAGAGAINFSIVTPPSKGTLSGIAPAMTYTPNAGATGIDSFSYRVSQGGIQSDPANVTVTIIAVNHAPVASSKVIEVSGGQANVLLEGSDVDGDTLQFTVVSPPEHGQLSGAGAQLVYTADAGFYGADALTFVAEDASSQSAPATISLQVLQPQMPVAESQSLETQAGQAIQITLRGSNAGSGPLSYAIISQPQFGTLAGIPPNVTYTPNSGFVGSDSWTFDVSQGSLGSAPATVIINVLAQNHSPSAKNIELQVMAGEEASLTLSGSDQDGDILLYRIVAPPVLGTVSGTPPFLIYHALAGEIGTDTMTYVVSDGQSDSPPATVTVELLKQNQPPTAFGAELAVTSGQALPFKLNANDPDGDVLSFVVLSLPSKGSLTGSAPNLVYTATPGEEGVDSFSFYATDGRLNSSAATVTINVQPAAIPPRANDVTAAGLAGTPVRVTLQSVGTGSVVYTYRVSTPPDHGKLSGTGRDLTYTPNSGWSGTDRFEYVVSDGTVESAPATVTLEISPINHAPISSNFQLAAVAGRALTLRLGGADIDGDPVSFRLLGQPTKGALTGTPPLLVYTADANASGVDTFSYVVSDGTLESVPGEIRIEISPIGPVQNVSRIRVEQGQVVLAVSGGSGTSFTVETSTDAQTWTKFTAGITGPTGMVEVRDSSVLGHCKLYRIVWQH